MINIGIPDESNGRPLKVLRILLGEPANRIKTLSPYVPGGLMGQALRDVRDRPIDIRLDTEVLDRLHRWVSGPDVLQVCE